MPNYPKPLWVVLNPEGRPITFTHTIPCYKTIDAATYAARCHVSSAEQFLRWNTLQCQGYRCVKATLSWEAPCPKS